MKEHADIEWKDFPPPRSAGNRPAGGEHGDSWDDQPVVQMRLGDLDVQALAEFRQRAGMAEEGDAALVEQLQLFHLKRAAVLLFHASPEKLVAGAYIRIGHFNREHELIEHHLLGGHLFAQLQRSLELLEQHLQRGPADGEALPPERYPVPLAALREALLNAIVHKDYASGLPVQIRLHADRIQLWNPARLPEDWSVASLKTRLLSRPANPDIAHAFQRAGLIGGWGLGIDKLLDACRGRGLAEPVLRREQDGLWVEFSLLRSARPAARRPASALPDMPAGHVASKVAAHVAGEGTGEVAGEETSHVAMHVAGEVKSADTSHVAGEVERLLRACSGVMSRKALQNALGLKSDANFRTLYLVPALEAGLLEMTIPDKPKSSRQQYRLSAAGLAWRRAAQAG